MKRITTFILYAVLACFVSYAGDSKKYYSSVSVKAESGKGLVYVSESSAEPELGKYVESMELTLNNKESETTDIYLFAKPLSDGEEFRYWLDSSNNQIFDSKLVVKGSEDSSNPNRYDYTAVFGTPVAVRVETCNPSWGSVSISNLENRIGDEVTVKATVAKVPSYNCRNLMIDFVGWRNDKGEYVSTEKEYTFTVTENQLLDAVFRNKNSLKTSGYYRVRNIFNRVLSIVGNYKYQSVGLSGNFLDGLLHWRCPDDLVESDFANKKWNATDDDPRVDVESLPEAVIYLDGSSLDLNAAPNGDALKKVNAFGQGTETKAMTGQTLTIKPAVATCPGYYILYGGLNAGLKMTHREADEDRDGDGVNDGHFMYCSPLLGNCKYDDPYCWMALQPIDEEHMDDFWFGASASESMSFEGGYWTSMYTGFPYECRDGVEAYYAKESVEANGINYIQLEKIESGIVPAYSAVLLKCRGTRSRQNRLLPLDFNASYPELDGNLLTGIFQLYTDKDGSGHIRFDESKMRVFGSNEAGDLGFYKLASNGDGTIPELKTNKVYLDLTKLESPVSGPLRIRINREGSSGIGEIESVAPMRPQDNIIYDLSGRRVVNPQPGSVYIRNGRKFVMK